jgi:hypothetical protein
MGAEFEVAKRVIGMMDKSFQLFFESVSQLPVERNHSLFVSHSYAKLRLGTHAWK